MGGRPALCSAIQSTPWQAVCRGSVCSAIVACTEIIPAFVTPPLHNLPPPQRQNVNTFFCTFPCSFLTPLGCFHGDRIWRTRAVTYPQRQLFRIKHQLSALHTGPQKRHIFTVDCQHCAQASVCSSMEQERQLSLFWNNGVALCSS